MLLYFKLSDFIEHSKDSNIARRRGKSTGELGGRWCVFLICYVLRDWLSLSLSPVDRPIARCRTTWWGQYNRHRTKWNLNKIVDSQYCDALHCWFVGSSDASEWHDSSPTRTLLVFLVCEKRMTTDAVTLFKPKPGEFTILKSSPELTFWQLYRSRSSVNQWPVFKNDWLGHRWLAMHAEDCKISVDDWFY